jgi:predicted ATP-grasp superfamily ATP-dependent carboligase
MRNGGVPASSNKSWLVKPFQSGGGHGVRRWRDGSAPTNEPRDVRVPRHCYLQEFVPGRVGSVVFVAAGGRAVPLGVTCQLVGDRTFGAADYRYCGNILVAAEDHQFAGDEMLVERVSAIAQAIAEDFQLIGVNGIDFVDRDGVPYAIEVNPRWSASMELVERMYGLSVFGLHAAACAEGVLPDFDLADARRSVPAFGKAIVFSRRNIVVGDTSAWLADDDGRAPVDMGATIRDVPHPGEQISAGSPVCTVFAAGRDATACYDALVERAARVYGDLAMPEARATISG